MKAIRIRVTFDDSSLLSVAQRSDGMKHSWMLLEPNQHPKISDLCTHLLHNFHLHTSCPNGILLSMEGFVLPQSEPTRILKDEDIICVKRKGVALAEAVEGADACDLLNDEVNRREPVDNGMLLLADEEFDKETGGYQSEYDDAEVEKSEDEPSLKETSSKKRKASTKLRSSKKKKRQLVVTNGVEDKVPAEDSGINDDAKVKSPSKEKRKKKHRLVVTNSVEDKVPAEDNGTNDDAKVKSPSKEKRKKKHRSGVVIGDEDDVNNGESIVNEKISKKKTKPNEEINQANPESGDKKVKAEVEGVEHMSSAPAKKVPSRSARRKKAKRIWMQLAKKAKNPNTCVEPETSNTENKEATGRPVPAKVKLEKITEEESNHNHNGVTELVPCVVRPGHIRFEPLDEDEDTKPINIPDVTFQWNGIISKKKGQKWGLEKSSTSKMDYSQKATTEPSAMLTVDAQEPLVDPIYFDQLPLCSSPKEGDLIAYRVLELSSSWTPELSSFRVGKISYYDADNIILMPVPEYPIVLDKIDENGPDNNSLYKEDGSLEIKFAALADVRSLKLSSPDAVKAVSNRVSQTAQVEEKNATSNLMSSSNDKENVSKDPSPAQPVIGNKEGNTLAELEELISAKKSELLGSTEEMKKNSGWNKWSYRALRGSALGPTISLLRSESDI